jgi:hypothetical protein
MILEAHYTSLSLDEIKTRFQRMEEKVQKEDTEEIVRNKLKSLLKSGMTIQMY